jgi:ABC-type microcin C transport system duplicated ATPase subunit YejF
MKAVNEVELNLLAGETVVLVGESGSGKTTIARAIIGLRSADGGSIRFEGIELVGIDRRRLKAFREEAAILFQDPIGSLSPCMSVGGLITESFVIHDVNIPDRRSEAVRLLGLVHLHTSFAERFPHELSGGQARQGRWRVHSPCRRS